MTIFGSDVSHYDAPDTRAMFAEGVVFQTHKAGGDANDAELATWWNHVKSYRGTVLLGAYWVLYPGRPGQRADEFISRLDSQCPGWRDGPFILQADCEKWSGDASTVPPVSDINAFCDHLVARMPKLRPIGYLPDWVYGDISSFRYPLWSSKYVTGSGSFKSLYPGDSSKYWAAYGGKSPDVLQYTSSATMGGQTTCDANAFRGTLDQLTALLAPGWAKENINMDLTQKNLDDIAAAVHNFLITDYADAAKPQRQLKNYVWVGYSDGRRNDVINAVNASTAKVLDAMGKLDVDETAIATSVIQGVLAGLAGADGAAETIADAVVAALPPDIAQEVVAEMGRLLSAEQPNS